MLFVDVTMVFVDNVFCVAKWAMNWLYLPMRPNVYLTPQVRLRILQHAAFWIVVLIILTVIYGAGMPDYWIAFAVVALFLPIHIAYFYSIGYVIIPKFFNRKKRIEFFVLLIAAVVFSTLAFRLM